MSKRTLISTNTDKPQIYITSFTKYIKLFYLKILINELLQNTVFPLELIGIIISYIHTTSLSYDISPSDNYIKFCYLKREEIDKRINYVFEKKNIIYTNIQYTRISYKINIGTYFPEYMYLIVYSTDKVVIQGISNSELYGKINLCLDNTIKFY